MTEYAIVKMCIKSVRTSKLNIIYYFIVAITFGIGCFLGSSLTGEWCDIHCCKKIASRDESFKQYLSQSLHYSKTFSTFLVVIIFSSPNNKNRRDTIRSTWLKTKDDRELLHYFVIGTASASVIKKKDLEEENLDHNDLMLLSKVKDYYTELTSKLLHSMIWLDNNVQFQFVLKVDDDSFAQLDIIHSRLSLINLETRLYWGFFNGKAHIKRKGQWNEDNWFLCDNYLPYALGGGYILSKDLVHFIATNSDYLQLYNSEDVSLGVWLAGLNIKRIHDPNFDTEFESRGCFNSYLVTHKQTIEQMKEKQKSLEERGVLCPNEFRKRLSYVYNWKAPPSLCCVRNDTNIP